MILTLLVKWSSSYSASKMACSRNSGTQPRMRFLTSEQEPVNNLREVICKRVGKASHIESTIIKTAFEPSHVPKINRLWLPPFSNHYLLLRVISDINCGWLFGHCSPTHPTQRLSSRYPFYQRSNLHCEVCPEM